MAMTPGPEEKAQKIKNLLNAYYETDQVDDTDRLDSLNLATPTENFSTAHPSPAPSVASFDLPRTEAAINSVTFDADAHLRRMVRETRLGSLVDEHRSLVAEVGTLDSDMQTLVYENYNKFIIATDIIRSLDEAMAGLDGRLRSLDGLIGGVAERSETVNGTLEQRQAAIMEMHRAQTLLQQLQVVLDVPRKLRPAVNSGAYDVVVETYRDAAPVLARHGHRKALRGVAADVEACRAQAADQLRAQLVSHPEEAAETIALIAQLDEPIESLQDDFLGCQRRRLTATLRAAEEKVEGGSAKDLQAAVDSLGSEFFAEMARTGALFGKLFDASCRPRLVAEAREWLLRYVSAVRSAMLKLAETSVAAAVRLDAAGRRVSHHGTGYHRADADFLRDWGVGALVGMLSTLREDLPRLETTFPELAPRDKASELVGNAVRQHVALAFTALEARVAVEVQELGTELRRRRQSSGAGAGGREALHAGLVTLQGVAGTGLERAVGGVAEWASVPHAWMLEGWAEVFATLVHSQMASWMTTVPRRCLAAGGVEAQPPTPAVSAGTKLFSAAWEGHDGAGRDTAATPGLLLLALSAFCSGLGGRGATRASQLLAGSGFAQAGTLPPAELGAPALEAAAALLRAYTTGTSAALAESMQQATDAAAWGQMPEPRAPSATCTELLGRLAEVDADLAAAERAFTAAAGDSADSAAAMPHHRRQSTGGGSMESGSGSGAAALGGKGGPAAPLPLLGVACEWSNRAEVACQVALAGLQARAGALRKHTLSRAGFQQVQLDCHFLRPQLQRAADGAADGQAVLSALEEMLVVAAERCAEPVMLEPAALDRMVASAAQMQRRP